MTYNKSFGSQSRMATLEGEAFFEVARDEEKPFKVSSGGVTTKVLGTSFNIKNERKNNKVEIVVSSGKVAFYSTVNPKKDIILTKGLKGIYVAENDSLIKEENTDLNVISWQNNTLIFENTPLKEVVDILNARFNVEITASEKEIYSCNFTSTFHQASLREILCPCSFS